MKVLKPGKKGTDWTIQHACTGWGNGGKGCDAMLEVEKKDLREAGEIQTRQYVLNALFVE